MTDREENNLALPIGSNISHYRIESVLGMGGFGIVYKARHEFLDDRVVAIKEFLPREMAGRQGSTVVPHTSSDQPLYSDNLQRFRNEGRTLAALQHNNVVHCQDLFDGNNTSYLIMDFEDGLPLNQLIEIHESRGTRYSEQQLLAILVPLAGGLAYVHSRDVLHRDIKPDNIFMRRSDESPVIIDFGAARQNYLSVTQTHAPFTPFYAPIEQMDTQAKPLPTLDIHAFGGLMYRMACGTTGPDAQKRLMEVSFGKEDPLQPASARAQGHYSNTLLQLIDQCLALKATDRPQTMEEVLQRLVALQQQTGDSAAAEKPSSNKTSAAKKSPRARKSSQKVAPLKPLQFPYGAEIQHHGDTYYLKPISKNDSGEQRSGWRLYFARPAANAMQAPQLLLQWYPALKDEALREFVEEETEYYWDEYAHDIEQHQVEIGQFDPGSMTFTAAIGGEETLLEHMEYLEAEGFRYSEHALLKMVKGFLDKLPCQSGPRVNNSIHPELMLMPDRWLHFGQLRQPGWLEEPGRSRSGFTAYDFPESGTDTDQQTRNLEFERGGIYSMGAILYRLACGFEAPNFSARQRDNIPADSVLRQLRPGYSEVLAKLIAACWELDAGKRIGSWAELATVVEQALYLTPASEPVLIKAGTPKSPYDGIANRRGMRLDIADAMQECRRHLQKAAGPKSVVPGKNDYSGKLLGGLYAAEEQHKPAGSAAREIARETATPEPTRHQMRPQSAPKPEAKPAPTPAAAETSGAARLKSGLKTLVKVYLGLSTAALAVFLFIALLEAAG
ncbi:protein kinase [Pseudomaricurvus sp. HS19]|uniref:protein kinase domain-containing protein n=1 Tax=Pseudomaricurvus sp. HS19 TaxID=2692626 RepID=UPI001370AA28|nr:protein kinase [Pseudomaricurvus sp. HS19]MYM64778.1 protein kinase [Pseudomaricurvus sp. HS19]